MNVTIFESKDCLTKRHQNNPLTGLYEKVSAGNMTQGRATPASVMSPAELVAVRKGLTLNQALGFGVPHDGKEHNIVTKSNLPTAPEGSIARERESFRWPDGAGWLMLDYDPEADKPALSKDELMAALYLACPALKDAPMVWGVSSSSYIFNTETKEYVSKLAGQRVYILVADGADIERAGKALYNRLWLNGRGRYDLSKAGSLLERTLIDAAVWQPERLDFAARPLCLDPYTADKCPKDETFNPDAAPFDSRFILDLSAAEQKCVNANKDALRKDEALIERQAALRNDWVDGKVTDIVGNGSLMPQEQEALRNRLNDAVTNRRLWGDFVLKHSSGKDVTVAAILADVDQWNNKRFYDPLEPDTDKRVAVAYLKNAGTPTLYCHKHGGITFKLQRQTLELELVKGDEPRQVAAALERFRADGDIFERGGVMVYLAGGEFVEVKKEWLQLHLARCFSLTKYDGNAKEVKPCNCPADFPALVLADRGNWGLPKVSGIVNFPVMRPDGSIIEQSGFDEQTGLLYIDDCPDRPVVQRLPVDQLKPVLQRIWKPFAQFPFENDLARSCFLAALLTTVCRPTLPTAPAFLVRAFAPGTGKSLLSECLMILAGAPVSATPLPADNQEEIQKVLFSILMKGRAGMVLDNLTGVFESSALCAILTSPAPEGRLLGKSEMVAMPNRALMVLNGNNVTAGGDLFRRVLPIGLDANTESPETRSFSFNPKDVIKSRLEAYRADLLTVLASFQAAGAPARGQGGFGSFDEWERLVRQCICWLVANNVTPAKMLDPLDVLEQSKQEDPNHLNHVALLNAWYARYGDRPVMVKDLTDLLKMESNRSKEEEALCEVLEEIGRPIGKGAVDSRTLSSWLRNHKGQIVAGKRLAFYSKDRKKGNSFYVAKVA